MRYEALNMNVSEPEYANEVSNYSLFNEALRFPEHQSLIERSQEERRV